MFTLFAQHVVVQGGGSWGIGDIVIAIVIIAAVVGVMYVALQQFGVTIPPFIVKIFWIVVAAIIAIVAIRFILTL